MEEKPIKGLDIASKTEDTPASPIPRRKRSATETNGHTTNGTNGVQNGKRPAEDSLETVQPSKKRTASGAFDDISPSSKRSKIQFNGASADDDLVVIDESADGAILIDD